MSKAIYYLLNALVQVILFFAIIGNLFVEILWIRAAYLIIIFAMIDVIYRKKERLDRKGALKGDEEQ